MVLLDITQVNYSVSPPPLARKRDVGWFLCFMAGPFQQTTNGLQRPEGSNTDDRAPFGFYKLTGYSSRVPSVILYSVACYEHSVLVLDSFVKF